MRVTASRGRRPAMMTHHCQEHDWVFVLLVADHGADVRVEAREHYATLPRVV